jgi:hypothetical protein
MFSFHSLGHFFGTVAHDIAVGAKFLQAHESQVDKGLELGAAVVTAADPALAPVATGIARAGEALVGEALAVISKLDAAASHPVTIELSVDAVNEFKKLYADIKSVKGLSAVPPAHLQ